MALFPDAELCRIGADFNGRMGWHIEDLDSTQVHQYKADQRFPTASVIKIAVLIELFRQAEDGRLALGDRHRLRGDISAHGSGVLAIARDEPELTLYDYARLMMGVSDNIATDYLMDLLGLDNINATLDRLGCPNVRAAVTLGRYHYRMVGMDREPTNRANDAVYLERLRNQEANCQSISYSDSLDNNVAAPGELAALLAAIVRGQLISSQASLAMLELLKSGRDTRMIRRYLKPEVMVAHKYGSSGIIKGDAGIIWLPTGPLVVVAFALAQSDANAGAAAIAEITRLAVAALAPDCLLD
ncbi:MAG: hypothetical protein GKR89_00115 [Candidatus Latescibacteria bacterium]|nr:hypothetical protein [Candidatus Latescibacterota bacterium]